MNAVKNSSTSKSLHNWISIVISVFALIISISTPIVQYWQADKHNKLSVIPLIDFYIFNDEKSGYKIKNSGVGPAIIHGVKAWSKDFSYQYKDWSDLVRNGLEYKGAYKCSDTLKQTAHQQGIDRKLIIIPDKLKVTKDTPVELEICYCSLDDEDCWINSTRKGNYKVESCSSFDNTLQC